MKKTYILLGFVLIVLFLFTINFILACIPSPGANIYFDDKVTINFKDIEKFGDKDVNYILEENSLIYRSISYPDDIAIKINEKSIIISVPSQDLSKQVIETIEGINWSELIKKELIFLKSYEIIEGLTDQDIEDISNCGGSFSIIKSKIDEKNIIEKKCNNWYRISGCLKGEICLPCTDIFSITLPPNTININLKTTNDKVSINIKLLIIIICLIILVTALFLVSRRFKK